ncbi:cytidine deaminase [bacterium SCSIO 12741]|nr:cytidine deaminase [bacterium SCSIO 12741]
MGSTKEYINASYDRYDRWEDLPEDYLLLLEKAKEVSVTAYARYSDFQVGSALKLDNGQIVSGTNQENAAYPSGLCAERVALFAAHSTYPDSKVQSIAVFARHQGEALESLVAPCGSCRQVMAEYESLAKEPLTIILADGDGAVVIEGTQTLLPFGFQFPENN